VADLKTQKARARSEAQARRKAAHASGADATDYLLEAISALPGTVVSGYSPIRTEIDPRPAMQALLPARRIVMPVVEGPGLPLSFRFWTPGAAMVTGAFGAAVPATPEGADPNILILPLLAFDARGYRLGYGGGFYDRTLQKLRAMRPTIAIGFAYAAQETESVPTEPTDQRLDMIVTEAGLRQFD